MRPLGMAGSSMRRLLMAGCLLGAGTVLAQDAEPAVKIEPPVRSGPRQLEAQTEKSVVRDYLLAWKSLHTALDTNDAAPLDAYFVGTAQQKLADTVDAQTKMGIHTRYVERSHDLQIIFYSPEGLSIQLVDNVEYDEQIMQQDKVLASKPIKRRYMVVMSPSEVRWRVRILQAEAGV